MVAKENEGGEGRRELTLLSFVRRPARSGPRLSHVPRSQYPSKSPRCPRPVSKRPQRSWTSPKHTLSILPSLRTLHSSGLPSLPPSMSKQPRSPASPSLSSISQHPTSVLAPPLLPPNSSTAVTAADDLPPFDWRPFHCPRSRPCQCQQARRHPSGRAYRRPQQVLPAIQREGPLERGQPAQELVRERRDMETREGAEGGWNKSARGC